MNKIITNLAQIADAAEYFDRKTGAAWKIRAALTNMLVWAANSVIYAEKTDSAERLVHTSIPLATLRTWARDCTTSAFVLDLTPAAVSRTLGLERHVDAHEEAVRSARQKCIQTRSALNFNKFYQAAMNAQEELRKQRTENVEHIAEMLSDNQVYVSADFADYCEVQAIASLKPESFVNDEDLYDDTSVERQADQLAETVGNALEAMYDVCEAELAAAITADKVNRLSGYFKAIQNMLIITGVDMEKLAERRAKLEALIEQQVTQVGTTVAAIDAEIAKQTAALAELQPEPKAPKKMRRVKA